MERGKLPLTNTRLSGEYVVATFKHECGPAVWDGSTSVPYQRTLLYGEHCPDCGWGIDFPIPDIDEVVYRLIDQFGLDDAITWARLVLARLRAAPYDS